MDDEQIGEESILFPFVAITLTIRFGQHFCANLYSCVKLDCIVGDFVIFVFGARCNGGVAVEDFAYIWADPTLRRTEPNAPLVIGKGPVVGMGGGLNKLVPADVAVVGNLACPLEKH